MTPPEPDKTEAGVHDAPRKKRMDKSVIDHLMAQDDKPTMLAEKHNDDKLAITLLIVGAGLNAYHFWWKMNGNTIIYNW